MNAPITPRFRQPLEPLKMPPAATIPIVPNGRTGTWVVLDRTSPFFAMFPAGEAPTTQYLPVICQFAGDVTQLGWRLDWERVAAEQRAQILAHVATKSGESLERVVEEIARNGVGIRITSAVIAKDYDNGRTLMA